jgi:argininosuccinate lyase
MSNGTPGSPEQPADRLWSGRFDTAPDPEAFDFGVSFPFDRRLFEDDVNGTRAC